MRAAAALLLVAALLAGCGDGGPPAPADSTVDATLVDRDRDGALEPGPGEPVADRADLAPAARPGAVLATLAQITDAHVRDEESPARVPFLDRFGGPFASTFRPQEALSTQVLTAAVRSVDGLAPDAVFCTGCGRRRGYCSLACASLTTTTLRLARTASRYSRVRSPMPS